jgi:hypothetical protein
VAAMSFVVGLFVAPTLCNSMGMAGSIVERWNA